MNSRNAKAIIDWTDRVRAFRVGGRLPPNSATMQPNSARISTHSSIEPSWFPQLEAILKVIGCKEFEFCATLTMVKSLTAKPYSRQPNEVPMQRNWTIAEGVALAIQLWLPRAAPASGRNDCTSAMISASMSAK